MSAIKLDTIEQYLNYREGWEPTYITSKKHGKILVPCSDTLLIRTGLIKANTYNPNKMGKDKLESLVNMIKLAGFCFPVVCIYDADDECFVVIDGFHRTLAASPDWMDLDYVPIVCLEATMAERMTMTWGFNKVKGHHQVDLDADVIRSLIEQGIDEDKIAEDLGIDLETVHRYKQMTGIADLFKNAEYSMSWGMQEVEANG